MNPKALDDLMWSDLPSLVSPLSLQEKTNMLKMDDKDIQMVTIKNIPPFVDELFFEEIFNVPDVRACISIKDAISQDELVRWVNSQYQFLLSDRSTTKKLSDAIELDTQKENFQQLMVEIKNGDEKINWHDINQNKYCIYYDCCSDDLELDNTWTCPSLGVVYCLSKDFVQIATKEIGARELADYITGQ